jgi:hypothetical protein
MGEAMYQSAQPQEEDSIYDSGEVGC